MNDDTEKWDEAAEVDDQGTQEVSSNLLARIVRDVAKVKTVVETMAPRVKAIDETLHVDCGIEDNGRAGLVSVVQTNCRFVRQRKAWGTGAKKALLFGGLTALSGTMLAVMARGVWLLLAWLF